MLICPIWAGADLYHLTIHNLDKLAISLDCKCFCIIQKKILCTKSQVYLSVFPTIFSGCVSQYFNNCGETNMDKESEKIFEGYKCVLNLKATEESMVCAKIIANG